MTKKKRPNSKVTKSRSTSEMVAVRKLSGSNKNINLFMLLRAQGEYFVKCTNVYEFEAELYIVLEHMFISLIQIVATFIHSKKIHITSIIDQIRFQPISFKRQY